MSSIFHLRQFFKKKKEYVHHSPTHTPSSTYVEIEREEITAQDILEIFISHTLFIHLLFCSNYIKSLDAEDFKQV